jgi:hypothetical protein
LCMLSSTLVSAPFKRRIARVYGFGPLEKSKNNNMVVF